MKIKKSVKKVEVKIKKLNKKLAFFSKAKKSYERQAKDLYWLK